MIAVRVWLWHALAVLADLFKQDSQVLFCREKILSFRPNHAQSLASLAHVRAGRGDYAPAASLLEAALAIEPSNANYWYNLGFVQQGQGNHRLAVMAFDQAIELNSLLDLAFYGKAVSLVKLGQLESALAALKINTQLQPMSPYGWYQLAHVYFRLHDTDNAKKIIARLARFEPSVATQLRSELQLSVDSY